MVMEQIFYRLEQFTDVWFERLGRRGDELKVTVNDGTHMGTISVGRQFNPHTVQCKQWRRFNLVLMGSGDEV